MGRTNVPEQAQQITELVQRLLGKQLAGVYLYGSAILSKLHADSDVDLLIITKTSLSDSARITLTRELLQVSGKIGGSESRPLEVTVINYSDIDPWEFPPKCEYQYGEWLREQVESGDIPRPIRDPDTALLLWQAREYSYPLTGPDAGHFIRPIPPYDIGRAIERSLPGLVDSLKGDERNVLLTLARMWYTLVTGKLSSKDKAAEWAVPRLPHDKAGLLEGARKAYLGEYHDNWTGLEQETAALASYMRAAIETCFPFQPWQ